MKEKYKGKHIEKKKIDIVIVDRYKIKNTYLKKIKNVSKLVVISDLNRINYYADLIVNGFIGYQNKIVYLILWKRL